MVLEGIFRFFTQMALPEPPKINKKRVATEASALRGPRKRHFEGKFGNSLNLENLIKFTLKTTFVSPFCPFAVPPPARRQKAYVLLCFS